MKSILILVTGLALALTPDTASAALGGLGSVCDSESISTSTPIGTNDSYQTPFNTNLVVATAQGMLANDLVCSQVSSTVVLASTVTVPPQSVVESIVTPPSNGVLITGPTFDGHFTYVPSPGFVGGDTYTYLISDGTRGTAGPITVTVQVGGPSVVSVPTLSQWGLVSLLLLLGGAAAFQLRRRATA